MSACSVCNGVRNLLGQACPLCEDDPDFGALIEDSTCSESGMADSQSSATEIHRPRFWCLHPDCVQVTVPFFTECELHLHIRHMHGWDCLPDGQRIECDDICAEAQPSASPGCWEYTRVSDVLHPICWQTEALTSMQHQQLCRALQRLACGRPEGLSVDRRMVYHNIVDPNLSLQVLGGQEEVASEVPTWEEYSDINGEVFFMNKCTGEICYSIEDSFLAPIGMTHESQGKPSLSWIPATCYLNESGVAYLASAVPQLPPSQMFQPVRNAIAQILTAALPELDPEREWLPEPGDPLQVVVKVQRIQLGAGDPPTLNYSGLWHVDGTVEQVKAVILYYTHVDKRLVGGNLAFISRGLHEDVEFGWTSDVQRAIDSASTILPAREGSVVCFRNDELLHRVKEISVSELREQALALELLHFDNRDVGLKLELHIGNNKGPKRFYAEYTEWVPIKITKYDHDTGLHTCQQSSGVIDVDLKTTVWRLAAPWQPHSVVPYSDPREQEILTRSRAVCQVVMYVAVQVRRAVKIPYKVWKEIVLPMVYGTTVMDILQGRPLVREFIALFVIDPDAPLGALEDFACDPDGDGYISSVSLKEAEETRARLLEEQLRKKDVGSFVVVSTGNGDCHDLFHTRGVDALSDKDKETQANYGFTRRSHAPEEWKYIPDALLRQNSGQGAHSTGGRASVVLDSGGPVWEWDRFREPPPQDGDNPNV